ncbi:MAG: VWA domain-containing protein, partial [Chitinophagaceae bacterium]|nr:VWA domain-containing protein [Chitinophagaceae bacterium]
MPFFGFHFAQPYWFILLLGLPFFIYYQRPKKQTALNLSFVQTQANQASWKQKALPFLVYLRYLAYLFFIVAMARPQKINTWQTIHSEGVDIILSLDISGSMLAEDFQPNRLEAAKKMAIEFTENRLGDRLGLVIFSGESFSQCPLTT